MPQQSLPTPAEALQGQSAHGTRQRLKSHICCLERSSHSSASSGSRKRATEARMTAKALRRRWSDRWMPRYDRACPIVIFIAALRRSPWPRGSNVSMARPLKIRPRELQYDLLDRNAKQDVLSSGIDTAAGFPLSVSASRHGANINWATVW